MDATQQLRDFFAHKSQTGNPITEEEASWLEEQLQLVEVETVPQIENPFVSDEASSQPHLTAYDPIEVLRKYEDCYNNLSSKQLPQPSVRQERLRPKPIWPMLNSREVLSPIIGSLQEEARDVEPVAMIPSEVVEPSNEIVMTRTADAIMKILGETMPKPTSPAPINAKISTIEPVIAEPVILEPVVLPTPNTTVEPVILDIKPESKPQKIQEPPRLVLDVPDDSETQPKRMKVQEEAWSEFVFESPAKFEPDTPLRQAAKAVSTFELPQFTF